MEVASQQCETAPNKTNKTQKYFKYLIDTSNRYIYSTYTQYI